MYVDPSGHLIETGFDIASLLFSVAEVACNPSNVWAWIGLAGDLVDLIPIVSGVGEATDVLRIASKADDIIDAADDVYDSAKVVYKFTDATDDVIDASRAVYRDAGIASDLHNSVGSYVIKYKSGNIYVGKGGFQRAIHSAKKHATDNTDTVTAIIWKSNTDNRAAFINEYLMQDIVGGVSRSNKNILTYNKIWSPGRKYYGLLQ